MRKGVERRGGREDDRTTWTGKRVRGNGAKDGAEEDRRADAVSLGVGKYLRAKEGEGGGEGGGVEGGKAMGEVREEWDAEEQPVRKKVKGGGGFGNFDGW